MGYLDKPHGELAARRRKLDHIARKPSVVIEKDERGFRAWCPALKGCQSEGSTLEEAMAHIKEAIELYLETVPALSRIPDCSG